MSLVAGIILYVSYDCCGRNRTNIPTVVVWTSGDDSGADVPARMDSNIIVERLRPATVPSSTPTTEARHAIVVGRRVVRTTTTTTMVTATTKVTTATTTTTTKATKEPWLGAVNPETPSPKPDLPATRAVKVGYVTPPRLTAPIWKTWVRNRTSPTRPSTALGATTIESKSKATEKPTSSPASSIKQQALLFHKYWPCLLAEGDNMSVPFENGTRKCQMLTTWFVGALGNEMFTFASLLGLTRTLGKTPFLPDENIIREVFQISAPGESSLGIRNISTIKWNLKWEQNANAFNDRFYKDIPRNGDAKIVGYFQSWKYFVGVLDLVRSQFTFRPEIQEPADHFLLESIRRTFGNDTKRQDIILIAIHVRRSGMYNDEKMGYTVADKDYIRKATTYFETAFWNRRILYIVCSDPDAETLLWRNSSVSSPAGHPLVFSKAHSAGVDLAIIASCDHVIQTVGTFGWWGAFLSAGRSTFYKNFPKPGSKIARSFKAADYYFPDWVPL